MKLVTVRILDHEYLLKSEEDEEQVRKIVEYVNGKLKAIQESSEGISERKAAILAAFHIASDYFQLLNEREGTRESIRRRAKALMYDIDSVMS